ncbi:MAG: Gfo/Idh/MocA family oxidoreductase [Deltaproteobacteria bacterium]
MTSRLRVGIVGCGLVGNKRARVIKEDPFSRLCCATDLVVSKAESLVKQFGDGKATAYQDWQEMLDREEVDAVIVSTPNKYLREITLQAAQKKIHVLCEKPLGQNSRESKEMVEAAKRNNVILKTGFNHRYHPAIFKAHELLEEGTIGEIYYAKCIYGHGGRLGYEKGWRASRDICGGGELLDQGVHVVDLFRWFLGDFEEAFGALSTYYWDVEVEDNAFALFKTAKGQTASMHTSWTQWKNRFTFEIYGEAGYLILEGLGGSYGTETLHIGKRKLVNGYKLLDDKEQERRSVNSYKLFVDKERKIQSSSNEPITNQPITNNVGLQYAGGVPDEEIIEFPDPDISWEDEWKEFTASIREKREPLGNGEDGLEANRMIEAVYRSARENRPVKIKEIT